MMQDKYKIIQRKRENKAGGKKSQKGKRHLSIPGTIFKIFYITFKSPVPTLNLCVHLLEMEIWSWPC